MSLKLLAAFAAGAAMGTATLLVAMTVPDSDVWAIRPHIDGQPSPAKPEIRPYVRFTDTWKREGLYEQEARNPSYDFSARFDAYAVLQSCTVAAAAMNGDRYPDQALDRDTANALQDELIRDPTPEDRLGEDASVRTALLHINDLCGFIIYLAGQREEAANRKDLPHQSESPPVDLRPIGTFNGKPCALIDENTFQCPAPTTTNQE